MGHQEVNRSLRVVTRWGLRLGDVDEEITAVRSLMPRGQRAAQSDLH
jgi:hypothetical protein